MPIQGIQFTIANNTEAHRSFQSTGSFVAYNPNDGVCFVSLDRTATSLQFDHRLPSQSGGRFPGPINSYLSLYYQDQSGSNTSGQVIVYPTPDQIELPHFWSIGRAIQASGTTVDISQGTQPQNPPASTTRLWVDGNGDLHLLSPTGSDNLVYDSSNIGTVALGGDLYGTINNGHVGLANLSPINARYTDGSLRRFIGLWNDNNTYFFIRDTSSNWWFYNDAAGVEFSIDGSGNVLANGSIRSNSYIAAASYGSIGAQLNVGAYITLGASQYLQWLPAVPARDDYLNFGGNGSLANAQSSRLLFRRNYDNVAAVSIDGTGALGANTGTFGSTVQSAGFSSTSDWYRIATTNGLYCSPQGHGIYWPNAGPACEYPSGQPFATYPFTYIQYNASGSGVMAASTWTPYTGLVQTLTPGTWLCIAQGIFANGSVAANFELGLFINGGWIAGVSHTIPNANYWASGTITAVLSYGSNVQIALEVLTSASGCTWGSTGIFSGGVNSRIVLVKIG